MSRKVLLFSTLVVLIGIFSACTDNHVLTQPSPVIVRPDLTLNPVSVHMSVGDSATFTAGGGNGSYNFSLVFEGQSAGLLPHGYFEVNQPSSNELKVKLVKVFRFSSTIVEVRSDGQYKKAYIYLKK